MWENGPDILLREKNKWIDTILVKQHKIYIFKYIKASPIITEAVCGRVWMTHIPAFLDFFLVF